MAKRIAILGSTGSIGCNTLEVVEHLGPPYRVTALSAHTQSEKLIEQVRRHRPAAVANLACGAAVLLARRRNRGILCS